MLQAFLYAIVMAFGLIMPLGVQNIFIFNQGATQKHFLHALPSVFTAGICDTILISLAVLGVSVAVLHDQSLRFVIYFVGFFFLLYMGFVTWRNKPATQKENPKPLSARRQILFSMSVSLLNPHAIIDSVAVIGVNSLHFSGAEKLAYTLGCILISWSWFFGLSVAGHTVHRLDRTGFWLIALNKLSAIIIWSVAAYIGWQLIFNIFFK